MAQQAAAPAEPNVDFGYPAIFFDSHPEQQPSYLGSYWAMFKSHLYIAWSGDVPKRLNPGTLRLTWWTTDNVQGLRDYELHQHSLVKTQYDSLCGIPDVSRCMIMGFSGQNPYIMTYGHNIWQEKFRAEKRKNNEKWLSEEERSKRREERERREEAAGGEGGEKKKGLSGKIDELIMSNEESETQRLLGGCEDMA
ncbi:hypothetical protein BDV97DRAFT_195967 [Delphinella strobiligena]|nr:hypothetical protein BDV97DRAFT_195967 [Delphinella strobiligena]